MSVSRAVTTTVGAAAIVMGAGTMDAQTTPAAVAEAVTVSRAPGTLAGTLLVPSVKAPMPVVLLISGSGPTDRDGNGPGIAPGTLRQLAESLAVRGIATLRFDKRVVGGSLSAMLPEAQLSFELLAEDVAAWLRLLAEDRRFSPVIVAGHSEGALLGLLAMRQTPAAGYVSIAGPARPADEVLHDQLAKQLPPDLLAQSDSIMARIKRGETVDAVPTMLVSLFRPSVQPYLTSWFKHSARDEIARLTMPCLIVQGSHDLQVEPMEADLLAKANPRCRVARFPGMNHVLKETPADMTGQLPSYRAPDAPLASGLADAIAEFVKGVRP